MGLELKSSHLSLSVTIPVSTFNMLLACHLMVSF